MSTLTLGPIKRTTGVAGQIAYTTTVALPEEEPREVAFVGSVYGSPGPVVMVTPCGGQRFVHDAARFGDKFDRNWVVRFFKGERA